MSLGITNLGMFIALAAVGVPVLIHLLFRRRRQVVEWGAMQFLQVSATTRRRWWLEEFLLLALRMGLVAVLVLALAGPFARGSLVSGLSERPPRDTVLILDASLSMALSDGRQESPFDQARRHAQEFVRDLGPEDRVALLLARTPPQWLAPDLSADRDLLLDRLAALPAPAGGTDWPAAVLEARRLLEKHGRKDQGEILLLRDRQRFGWADEGTLARWADADRPADDKGPPLRLLDFTLPTPAGEPAQAWLTPLASSRRLAWPGQKVRVSSTVHRTTTVASWPWQLQVFLNGQVVETIPAPPADPAANAPQPVSFSLKLHRNGPNQIAVRLFVEADGAAKSPERSDWLPADNRQELTVDVVENLPLLIVKGEGAADVQDSAFFLDKALTPLAGEHGALKPRVVTVKEFRPELIQAPLPPGRGSLPVRVVVLADVPHLETEQVNALDRYLEEGGNILVILGSRAHQGRETYDRLLDRQGRGWLPLQLVQVQEKTPLTPLPARPDPRSFQHPALEVFRRDARGAFDQVAFGQWWLVTPAPGAVTAARLSSGEPWLVERAWKKGRVLVCTTPLDRSWDSSFPTAWEFPVFVHELAAYLAGAGHSFLGDGQPPMDPRESDLTPCSQDEERRVQRLLGVAGEPGEGGAEESSPPLDLWWLLMLVVIGFLCLEIALTRKIAAGRGGAVY